jgi:hypothetical protein
MARRYTDFFRELEHCLDPNKNLEDNVASLNERYKRVRNQTSSQARVEQAMLDQALKVFENETSYREYRREWEAAKRGAASQYKKELEQQRRKAREAEAAQRREAERRKELERQLKEEHLRADEAERQAQLQDEKQSSGFWDTFLKGVAEVGAELLKERLTGKVEATPEQPTQAYRPGPIDLSGDWGSYDGNLHRIRQRGNQIQVQAINPSGMVVMEGNGTFDGHYLRVLYQTAPGPTIFGLISTAGEAHCEVSDDGRSIHGQARNKTLGQVFPVNLYR